MDYKPLTSNETAKYIIASWLAGKKIMFKKTWVSDNGWTEKPHFNGKAVIFDFETCYYRVVE